MTAVLQTISQRQALKLWAELRSHFVNANRVIEEIIEKSAWEPLGYVSFSEAWAAQMANITVATEVRPQIVYQLITEGGTDEEIAELVKGIGRDRAASLRRQKGNGVPASHASLNTHVRRESVCKNPSAADTIHLKLGVVKLRRYQRTAKRLGMSVEDIALQAIEARFAELS